MVIDIFSRAIVGWLLADREDTALAEQLIADAWTCEGIAPHQLTVHADRGAPMTSKRVSELLLDLGVTRAHSRPTVSNDKPYAEAQFKTMTYGPGYPDRCASLADARTWVAAFVTWYHTEHRHRGIGLLTPQMVHDGRASAVVATRQQTLDGCLCRPPGTLRAGATSTAGGPHCRVDQPAATRCFGRSGGDSGTTQPLPVAARRDGRTVIADQNLSQSY